MKRQSCFLLPLPYTNAEWAKLSILPNLLIDKLPAPKEEDLSEGVLDTIEMERHHVEGEKVVQRVMTDVMICSRVSWMIR